jgi:hypothetical protein
MPYIKHAVSSLAQGVSQQAESQRHPSQAAEQINAYSSHVKGLVKRPPTKHISSLDVNAGTGANSFIHLINRDAEERYAIVINKGVRVDITSVGFAADDFLYYSHATAAQFIDGHKLQFFRNSPVSQLPFGLVEGEEYYVRSHALISGTDYKFEVSKTSGGAKVKLGQVELTESALGEYNYKAGILIESVKIAGSGNDAGEWIDGVLTVRFSDPTSGSGHNFVEGDNFQINRLEGTTKYILQSDVTYGLTQKGTDGNAITQMMGAALTTSGDSHETNNKFWVRNLQNSLVRSENYGFYVDRDQLPPASEGVRPPEERVGWFSVTSADKWVADEDTLYRIAVDGSNPLDYANIANGQLMRIGTGRKNPRGIKVGHGTGNITHTNLAGTTTTYTGVPYIQFAEDVDSNVTFDDAAAKTIQLYYWASLLYSDSGNSGTQRCPLPTDYRSALTGQNSGTTSWAYVGEEGTTFAAEGGVKGSGPHVHDVKTGTKYPLEIGEPGAISYLLDVDNPATDIKAATVGDTTFLLNTTIKVAKDPAMKHHKSHEAFISIDSADYGKQYKIKVGDEAVTSTSSAGIVAKSSRCWLYGAATSSNSTRKIAMIRSRHEGNGYNGKRFRLTQNWGIDRSFVNAKSNRSTQKWVLVDDPNNYADFPPNVGIEGGWYQPNKKTSFEMCFENRHTSEYGAATLTPKASIFPTEEAADMAINFFWHKKGGNTNSTSPEALLGSTTVAELIVAFNGNAALQEDWEMVACDATGLAVGETGVSVAAVTDIANTAITGTFIFHKAELHHQLKTEDHDYWGEDITTGVDAMWASVAEVNFLRYKTMFTTGLFSLSIGEDYLHRGKASTTLGTGTVETTTVGSREVYDGEFFYRTPKWTGNAAIVAADFNSASTRVKTQRAIGTERIAEMLAGNVKIIDGVYYGGASGDITPSAPLKVDGNVTADGRYEAQHEEEGLGMSYRGKVLGRLSDASKSTWVDGAKTDWIVVQDGNIISIRHPEGKPFDVVTSDDMGGNAMSLTFTEVSESVKLPAKCRHGHVVRVVGDAREEADDYYLRFEADNPDDARLLEGRWVESIGFDLQHRFNRSTMPVTLVRDFNPTYETTANPQGKFFRLERSPWNTRNAGDDRTNPFPSMVGNKITDIFLHKNRLGLIAGESVILSEAGEHFNLFRTTTAALLDTAPIDITASTNMVSHLKHAIPFADQLIVFSEQAQFSITGDPYISPKTVQITATSHFSNSATAKPVNAGNNIFFAFKRSNFGAVSEYFKSRDQVDAMESKDISAHIPKYIAGNILSISSCPEENALVCLTDDATQAIVYIYKYFTGSDGSKTQSAWFKYVFGGAKDRVLACKFIHNILYLVIKRDTVVGLESLVFEDSQKDTDMDYEVLLDRRLDVIWDGSAHVLPTGVTLPSSPTPLYDTNTGKSTVTLSYVPEAAARVQVVRADGKTVVASDLNGEVAQFPINLTGVSFYIGDPYTLEYAFSKPFLRKNTGSGGRGTLMGGRQQLMRGNLEFTNARQFTVAVTHLPENTVVDSKYAFTGVELGFATGIIGADTLSEGFYPFGIMGRNDRVSIKITNPTPYPSDFLSLDYEGRAYARGNRWTG